MEQDKIKHAKYGFYISLSIILFFAIFGRFILDIAFIGIAMMGAGTSTFIGLCKEVYDKVTGKGKPELMDFLFTSWGGIVPAILYVYLYMILSMLLGRGML